MKTSPAVLLSETQSLCPICLQRVKARRVVHGEDVYLEKTCDLHGDFRVIVWRGNPEYGKWGVARQPSTPPVCDTQIDKGCPYDCGLCPDHRQHSCCVLLEITSRCNLGCPVCFAQAGSVCDDPSLADIEGWYRKLLASGGPFNIQLSGGEPTMREDLPEIIAMGRSLGFGYIQLNTNGLRLATEPGYVQKLKNAGLSCVFLQFDGTRSDIYEQIRGKSIFAAKEAAVASCAQQGLGVVLVATLVPGVNTDNIGDLIKWGVSHAPTVRGVHFQPISYFGRYPLTPQDHDRITLPELMREIERQTDGKVQAVDLRPPGGENSYCSFHGNYVVMPDGELQALVANHSSGCCQSTVAADGAKKAQAFVAKRWTLSTKKTASATEKCAGDCCGVNVDSLDFFLSRVEQYSFCISAMAFQDAWNLDLDRLRDCFIHVMAPDGKLIPFCAYNLTSQSGAGLYRPGVVSPL